MSKREVRFSPLAELQIDAIWDYGYRNFGLKQADKYLDGIFDAINQVVAKNQYNGLPPRLVPPELINTVTSITIHYFPYEKHFIYLRDLSDGALGVICILGARMDTPSRLKESLLLPVSDMKG